MFQCKDLLNLTTMSEAKIIAGKNGLDKCIRWAYKAENSNFEKWVHGQELLIISAPVTQRRNYNLYATINKAISLDLSCALLLVGDNYVDSIDEEVIKLSNTMNFPLFTLPCTVPLVDFFEELGHAIAYLDDRKNIKDNFLAEFLFGNTLNIESVKKQCSEMNFSPDDLQHVIIVHIMSMKNDDVQNYAKKLSELFLYNRHPALIYSYGDRIIGFIGDISDKRDLLYDIYTEFDIILCCDHKEIQYTFNIGEKCNDLKKLKNSFQRASALNSILMHIEKNNCLVFDEDLGFYQFIVSCEDKKGLIRFSEKVLCSILDYDKKNNTEFTETLWAFFESDRNLQKTADKMFTHKNTIKYRLKRIKEISGRDLDNSYQCLELYNALIIYRVLVLYSEDK